MTSPDSIDIEQNVALAPLTTLKVGGPARFFVRASNESQVAKAFEYADKNDLDVFVLGGGSNILVSDDGFNGLVVNVALKGVTASEPRDRADGSDVVAITASAGEDWDKFVETCVNQDLAGVECLSGIPGFVGGTPVQNVGAYGQEVSESIASVRCFDRATRSIIDLDNSECGFTYRTSIFNSTERDRYVVLSVTYNLTSNGEPKIAYRDLKDHFSDLPPTLKDTRDAVLNIRRAKSMVIDPDDPNSRSAGSFFKNPIVDPEHFEKIVKASEHENVTHFPAAENRIKVPAAWLIERAGFHKGFRSGKAGISTNHSLALVNLGGATAAEIVALKEKIQDGVRQKFDILLQPEPVFVGFE
ncbi:MAG: UDP-N-acetylmuramate dehydrogenase [Acidobacteriota bacterium]